MTSALDLDRFLAELGTRRERLLRLVEPAGSPNADLLDEVTELSEQLIVADEELRVQQEELDSARRALVDLSAERDLLLRHSTRAFVVTDDRGVVVQATGAVERLIRQPPIRVTPRPIATWFQVSDRRTVRAMISSILSGGGPQYAGSVTVRTSDGSQLVTNLAVERMPDAGDGRTLLRWELTQSEGADLHLLPNKEPTADADRSRLLIAELGVVATVLGDCRTTEEMFPVILDAGLRLVPGVRHVGLVLRSASGAAELAAWSSETTRRAETAQLHAGAGPLVDALNNATPVRLRGVVDSGYSGGKESVEDGPATGIAVPLVHGPRRLGVLTVYTDDGGAFDEDGELVAATLGSHVAVALARTAEISELRAGMQSRQVIGGAIGVLAERHHVTPEAAFALLVRRSQDTNVKVREIAQVVLETGQDPGQIALP